MWQVYAVSEDVSDFRFGTILLILLITYYLINTAVRLLVPIESSELTLFCLFIIF